jgi:DNA-binding LacI/PurR family transcriptional regulator
VEQRRRQPVIADVARAAGVSVPTVSRVLNGTAHVSELRRNLVLAAVKDLGYRPNGAALTLVTGRRFLVGVLTHDTTGYGAAGVLQGVEEEARSAGRPVAITVVGSAEDGDVQQAVDLALSQPVAGMVVVDFDEPGSRTIAALPPSTPVVVITSSDSRDNVPHVPFDDHAGGLEATRHLLGLGHRTVMFVGASPDKPLPGRALGWRAALEEVGVRPPAPIAADWNVSAGYAVGLTLADATDIRAVVCGNDEIAFGVVRALQHRGLRVPQDVSVVGFDDHPLAAYWSPPLTTIAQDFTGLGRAAVRLLLAAVDPDETALRAEAAAQARDDALRPRLVVRESTAGPPKVRRRPRA